MIISKLKPCPFCGGPGTPVNYGPCDAMEGEDIIMFGCEPCGVAMTSEEQWNTRAERTCEWKWCDDHYVSGCGHWIDRTMAPSFCQECGGSIVVKEDKP